MTLELRSDDTAAFRNSSQRLGNRLMSSPNYRVHVSFDGERKVFIARVPELPPVWGRRDARAKAPDQHGARARCAGRDHHRPR